MQLLAVSSSICWLSSYPTRYTQILSLTIQDRLKYAYFALIPISIDTQNTQLPKAPLYPNLGIVPLISFTASTTTSTWPPNFLSSPLHSLPLFLLTLLCAIISILAFSLSITVTNIQAT